MAIILKILLKDDDTVLICIIELLILFYELSKKNYGDMLHLLYLLELCCYSRLPLHH